MRQATSLPALGHTAARLLSATGGTGVAGIPPPQWGCGEHDRRTT